MAESPFVQSLSTEVVEAPVEGWQSQVRVHNMLAISL